jgi:hypothetical protein
MRFEASVVKILALTINLFTEKTRGFTIWNRILGAAMNCSEDRSKNFLRKELASKLPDSS